jgi:hypothetical protein
VSNENGESQKRVKDKKKKTKMQKKMGKSKIQNCVTHARELSPWLWKMSLLMQMWIGFVVTVALAGTT